MTSWRFWNRQKYAPSKKKVVAKKAHHSPEEGSTLGNFVSAADRWRLEKMFEPGIELLEDRQLMAAQIFSVTVANDIDLNAADLATAQSDGGGLSLREAIRFANTNNNGADLDQIQFAISGSGVQTITLNSALSITQQVSIEGFTQTGAQANSLTVGNNANYLVQLQSGYTGSTALITFTSTAGGSNLEGLVINALTGDQDAIYLNGVTGVTVQGNFIGITADGTASTDMGRNGIRVDGGGYNTIGGSTAASRNVIAGNYLSDSGATTANRGMIFIGESSGSTGNVIQGNYLGTNAAGNARIVSNTNASGVTRQVGVWLQNSNTDNTVIKNNVITTQFIGIRTMTTGIGGTQIVGNSIGVGADGTTNLGLKGSTTSSGFYGDVGAVTITGNIFANNNNDGIRINSGANGSLISNNVFQNNLNMGVNFSGTTAVTNVTVTGNTFVGNRTGIESSHTSMNGIAIVNNTFTGQASYGISTTSTSNLQNVTISGNSFGGSSPYAMRLQGTLTNGVIAGNSVTGATVTGIDFSSTSKTTNTTISGNTFTGNKNGINFGSSTVSGVVFSSNTLSGNTGDSFESIDAAMTGIVATNNTSSSTGDWGRLLSMFLDAAGDLWASVYVDPYLGVSSLPLTINFYTGFDTLSVSLTDPKYAAGGSFTFKVATETYLTDQGIPVSQFSKFTAAAVDSGNNTSNMTSATVGVGQIGTSIADYPTGIGAIFVVTNAIADDPSAVGSFAWAIAQANAMAGYDAILFGIFSSTPVTISQSTLMNITDQVFIDGYSMLGTSMNSRGDGGSDATLLVELVRNTTGDSSVIRLYGAASSGSVIRGLAFNSNGTSSLAAGIRIEGSSNNVISGNFFNLGTSGSELRDTGAHGVRIDTTSSGNTIGGLSAVDVNVFGGNFLASDRAHIQIEGSNNVIAGNLIGTDYTGNTTGTTRSSTSYNIYGLRISGSAAFGNTIGGSVAGSRNVISGNSQDGIWVSGSSGNLIAGNYIGTDITGTKAIANGRNGVTLLASRNTVGGNSEEYRNVISGNGSSGVWFVVNASANLVAANYIGLNAAGTAAIKNGAYGVLVSRSSASEGAIAYNTVGGSTEGARNVISGNGVNGIRLDEDSQYNVIAGNWIGTNAAGTSVINNGSSTTSGIAMVGTGVMGNTVGGPTADWANVIVGSGYGVSVTGDVNQILYNTIGVLPNGGKGGTASGGVYVGAGTGNTIRLNSIAYNGGQGILLGSSSAIANDAGDPDTGVNNLQNYPVITNGYIDSNGHLILQFTIDSTTANSTYPMTIDLYRSVGGQGIEHVGTVVVNGPGTHSADLGLATDLDVSMGSAFVATATDGAGNTSQFSTSYYYIPPEYQGTFTNVYVVTNNSDDVATVGSLRWAAAQANASAGYDLIVFDMTTSTTIQLATTIAFTDRVYVTAYSQYTARENTLDVGSDANLVVQIQAASGLSTADGTALFTFANTGANGSAVRGFVFNSLKGDQDAIRLNGVSQITIAGNYIGVSLDGTTATDMGRNGIRIDGGGNNTIGGDSAADRNVIAGNYLSNNGTSSGNRAMVAIGLSTGSSANYVTGNYLGTDKSGLNILVSNSNASNVTRQAGVLVYQATSDGNTISGNVITTQFIGLRIETVGIQGTLITNNSIGVGADGVTNIGLTGSTTSSGIYFNGASDATVSGNVIANNRDDGIYVNSASSTGLRITQNSIYNNGDQGIDLTGVTSNDVDDADTGANFRMNFPELLSTFIDANGDLYVSFYQNSLATNQPYPITVELFQSLGQQGQTYLGSFVINGPGVYNFKVGNATALGITSAMTIVGTSTDATGNTSEFSTASTVVTIAYAYAEIPAGVNGIFIVTNTSNSSSTVGSLAWAASRSNAILGYDAILFALDASNSANARSADGAFLISGSATIDFTDRVFVDGFSQVGASRNTLSAGNNAVLQIVVHSSSTSTNVMRLNTGSSGSTITGLIFTNKSTSATVGMLGIDNSSNNVVSGNSFGVDKSGTILDAGITELYISATATNNTIGGSSVGDRNMFGGAFSSSGSRYLMNVFGSSNLIANNFVGVGSNGASSTFSNPSGATIIGSLIDGTAATNNTIGSNVFSNIYDGIYLRNNSTQTLIVSNLIGTDATGASKLGNGRYGIMVYGSQNNTIGVAGAGNLISGNGSNGINLQNNGTNTSDSNLISGNLIGVSLDGNTKMANSGRGIMVQSASNNTIGGSSAGSGNVISNSTSNGIEIQGSTASNASGNWIAGNTIGGASSDGNTLMGNTGRGILILNSSNNTVGGTLVGSGNVISANTGNGVEIQMSSATSSVASGNWIAGNLIGVSASGNSAMGNSGRGVVIQNSNNNTIGGTMAGARNVISGNALGIEVTASTTGLYSTGNLIAGNYVGVGADGVTKLGNAGVGIQMSGARVSGNTIGGLGVDGRNVVAGNGANGIFLRQSTSGNWVINNYVGLAADGTTNLGNGTTGNSSVVSNEGAINNTIGGPSAEYGNVIVGIKGTSVGNGIQIDGSGHTVMYNYIGTTPTLLASGVNNSVYGATGNGVNINSGTSNTVLYNHIANMGSSGSNGIAFGTGANNGQSAPTIVFAYIDASGDLFIRFTADAAWQYSLGALTMQIFEAIGGQGAEWLGDQLVTVAGTNTIRVANAAARGLSAGDTIVATVTDAEGDTSRFSSSVTVIGINTELPDDIVNIYFVTNTNASGTGSLTQALTNAGNSAGYDAILFNIDASNTSNAMTAEGTFLISSANLIDVFSQVYIDGYSQSGASANTATDGSSNAVIKVELLRTSTGSNDFSTIRFNTGSDNSVVRGLTFRTQGNATTSAGIRVENSTGLVIAGNFFGLAGDGITVRDTSANGVYVASTASSVTIGGYTAADMNVFAGNYLTSSRAQIYLTGSANLVAGNLIGTNKTGTVGAVTGSTIWGVKVEGSASKNNTIGGSVTGARNVISGNTWDGIYLTSGSGTGTVIAGNFIGTDRTGNNAVANGRAGVTVITSNNTVGGPTAEYRNVISGNNSYGVWLTNGASNNLISSNYVGTNVAGTAAVANRLAGVYLGATDSSQSGVVGNTVGGNTEGTRNLISGNNTYGVLLGFNASANLISGNYIGTDVSGNAALGNSVGVYANSSGANANTIGGSHSGGYGNVISGNKARGLYFGDSASLTGVVLAGNYFGSSADGHTALGNGSGFNNISITSAGFNNNTIGGASSDYGNYIVGGQTGIHLVGNNNRLYYNTVGGLPDGAAGGNLGDGILIYAATGTLSTGNTILNNSIANNGGLGINLSGAGANNNIASPTIGGAFLDTNGDLYISFSNASTWNYASSGVTIQFFKNGVQVLASPVYTASGTVTYKITNATALGITSGDSLFATATDADGNTSKFSSAVTVSALTEGLPAGIVNIFVVTNTNATGEGSFSWAVDQADAIAGYDAILFNIGTTDGPKTINLSGIIELNSKVYIDGYSQHGSSVNTATEGSNAVLQIIVNRAGGGSTFYVNGSAANNSTIRGIVFQNTSVNAGYDIGALKIENVTGVKISGNFFNTDYTGTAAVSTSSSALILRSNADLNTIGGSTPADVNIFGGNYTGTTVSGAALISIHTPSGSAPNSNVIRGNLIGVSADGNSSIISGSNAYAINIRGTGASGNIISNNLISSDQSTAVRSEAGNTQIIANQIGIGLNGSALTTRNGYGIEVTAAGNTITGNKIAGATSAAIYLQSANNLVQGNYLGTNAAGTAATGTVGVGLLLSGAADNNTIGGVGAGLGNVISGNSVGVRLEAGAANNLMTGNYIGVGADGTTIIANTSTGLELRGAGTTGNTIGGTAAGAGNVVGGNGGDGLAINSGAASNVVLGNWFGISADGTIALGNLGNGIVIDAANDNTIGGSTSLAGNVIAHNTGSGVVISGGASGNRIVNNAIGVDRNNLSQAGWGNGQFGIAVTGASAANSFLYNSVAYNAQGGIDLAIGSNNDQAAPIISSSEWDASTGKLTLTFSVANGGANTLVQFFLSQGGQGISLLGETTATGDGSSQTLELNLGVNALSGGSEIVAIATRSSGNGSSSEFSNSSRANQTPSISGTVSNQAINDNQTNYPPFSGVTIDDPDGDSDIVTVKITLSSDANGNLVNWSSLGFTRVFDVDTQKYVYSYTGTATNATTAIRSLLFTPTENQVAPGSVVTTVFTIVVTDSDGLSASDSNTSVNVTSLNDPPSISGTGPQPGITDVQTATPFTGVTFQDPDVSATLTVSIALNNNLNGTLAGGGFIYNSSTGLYVFTGTVAEVNAAIQSLVFTPRPNQVAPGQTVNTTFTITVSDQTVSTSDSATTITVTSINDPSVISGVTSGTQTILDNQTTHPFSTVVITDPDAESITVKLTLSASANGVLVGAGFVETAPGSGVYTMTGTAANITTALNNLVFVPTVNQVAAGNSVVTTVTLEVNDSETSSSDNATTIEAISYNDKPVLGNIPTGTINYPSSSGWKPLFQGKTPTVYDADVNAWEGGRLVISYSRGGGTTDNIVMSLSGSGFSVVTGDLFYGSVKVGTVLSGGRAGAELIIEFTGDMTSSMMSRLLSVIGYVNTSPIFTSDSTRSLLVSLFDGGGTAFGASNSTQATVNLSLPATPVPPPLIPLPDGALPQLDMTQGGGPGLDNSFPTVRNFLALDPVGAKAIFETNILTSFGPFQRDMMLSEFLGDSNPVDSRMERLFSNGWNDFNAFQTATQALLRQEFFTGGSISDSQRQMASSRIASVVTNGIFDGMSDAEIVQRVMSDFGNMRRRQNFEFSIDQSVVEEFIRQARRMYLDQLNRGGRASSTEDENKGQAAEENQQQPPQSPLLEVNGSEDAASIQYREERSWLFDSDSGELALDSMFSVNQDEDFALASHSADGDMSELVSYSFQGNTGDQQKNEEPAIESPLGVVGMTAAAVHHLGQTPESKDEKSKEEKDYLFGRIGKLLGLSRKKN